MGDRGEAPAPAERAPRPALASPMSTAARQMLEVAATSQQQHHQHHQLLQLRPRHGGLSTQLQQPHAGRSSSAQAVAAPAQLPHGQNSSAIPPGRQLPGATAGQQMSLVSSRSAAEATGSGGIAPKLGVSAQTATAGAATRPLAPGTGLSATIPALLGGPHQGTDSPADLEGGRRCKQADSTAAAAPKTPPPVFDLLAADIDGVRLKWFGEERLLRLGSTLAEYCILPGLFGASYSTMAASAAAAQPCSTPPAAAVAPASSQLVSGSFSPHAASPTKKSRVQEKLEGVLAIAAPEEAASLQAQAAAAAGAPAPQAGVSEVTRVRRLQMAVQLEQLCTSGIPDPQALAAFLVAQRVLSTPSELQQCMAAASAAGMVVMPTAALPLLEAVLANAGGTTQRLDDASVAARLCAGEAAVQVARMWEFVADAAGQTARHVLLTTAPAAALRELCLLHPVVRYISQLGQPTAGPVFNGDGLQLTHGQQAVARATLLRAALTLQAAPHCAAAATQLQRLAMQAGDTGLLSWAVQTAAVLQEVMNTDMHLAVTSVEDCTRARTQLEGVLSAVDSLAVLLLGAHRLLLTSAPESAAAAASPPAAAPAAAAAAAAASPPPAPPAAALPAPPAAAAAPAQCLLLNLARHNRMMTQIEPALQQAMAAARARYDAGQLVLVQDPRCYRSQREVAPAADMLALLRLACDQIQALADLDLDAGPPLSNTIILSEGGADQGPPSLSAVKPKHVLARSSLKAAIKLTGPPAVRTALLTAYEAGGELRALFHTGLQLYKQEFSLGALLEAGSVDAAAAVEAAVINRLGFARLLGVMFQVLVRGPAATAAREEGA